jgi:hypothetical protein
MIPLCLLMCVSYNVVALSLSLSLSLSSLSLWVHKLWH